MKKDEITDNKWKRNMFVFYLPHTEEGAKMLIEYDNKFQWKGYIV